MVEEKGKINTENLTDNKRFEWIKEFLDRVQEDALNIKEPEIVAIKEIVNTLEDKFIKIEYIKRLLTSSQREKITNKYLSKERKKQLLDEVF